MINSNLACPILFSLFQIRRKMMKAIRKEKRILFKEKLYAKKFELMKKGEYKAPVKVWNKREYGNNIKGQEKSYPAIIIKQQVSNSKKPIDSIESLDLNYEFGSVSDGCQDEEDLMEVTETNAHKLDEAEMKKKIVSSKAPHKVTDKFHKLTIDRKFSNTTVKSSSNSKKPCQSGPSRSNDLDKVSSSTPTEPTNPQKIVYSENKMMTCVDGFWIRLNKVVEVER